MDIRRRSIMIAAAVFTLFLLYLKPDILSSLFIFVFMGIIPGTDITLPWWVTLFGLLIALVASIRWLVYQPVYQPVATSKDRALRHAARRRVLKQTATRKTTTRRHKKQTVKV